jgi:inner membrane protease subunit 2
MSHLLRRLRPRPPSARASLILAKGAVVGYLGIQLLDTYVCTTRLVTGPSMSPALSPDFDATGAGDVVLLARLNHAQRAADEPHLHYDSEEEAAARTAGLRRGDVVSLWKPHDPRGLSIKRVLALPGDRVTRDPARRLRGGEGANALRRGMAPCPEGPLVVPPGHVWVEGDGWRNSFDSNDFGPVPVNLVTGRAVAIVWPPRRWGPIPPRAEQKGGTTVVPGGAAAARAYDWGRELEFR